MRSSPSPLIPPVIWPTVSPAEMAAVDRVMAEDLGFDLLQIMEVAGRGVAAFARSRFLGGDPRGRRVVVLAGGGGNGGDGLVAARYLLGWGAEVDVRLSRPAATLRGLAGHQHAILAALGVAVVDPLREGAPLPSEADLVIDALFGGGLDGPPTGDAAGLIEAANAAVAPILAVDLPSGLDGAAGEPFSPVIVAAATLTLAMPKTGLLAARARSVVGELHVLDIGIPAVAFQRLGLDPGPRFAMGDVVRLF